MLEVEHAAHAAQLAARQPHEREQRGAQEEEQRLTSWHKAADGRTGARRLECREILGGPP
jgi:hypothetical protein